MTNPLQQLRAYCGDEEARREFGDACYQCWGSPKGPGFLYEDLTSCPNCHSNDYRDSTWIKHLVPLIEAAATRECGRSGCYQGTVDTENGSFGGWLTCRDCKGTGQVTDPHALLRVCVAVAWECVEVACMGCAAGYPGTHNPCGKVEPPLHAARCYMKEPTEENRRACDVASPKLGDAPHDPMILGVHHLCSLAWDESPEDDFRWALQEFGRVVGLRLRATVLEVVGQSGKDDDKIREIVSHG